METFTWRVQRDEYSEKTAFAVREVQFGDGYTQIQPQGINNRKREIQAAISEKKATIQQIAAFFDHHAGFKAFRFRGFVVRVVDYQTVPLGGEYWRISFSLKEK